MGFPVYQVFSPKIAHSLLLLAHVPFRFSFAFVKRNRHLSVKKYEFALTSSGDGALRPLVAVVRSGFRK